MKKLALTIAIFLGISLSTYAQDGGGMFKYGEFTDENDEVTWYSLGQNGMLRDGFTPGVPGHGQEGNQAAPLGSGALLLIGFGAAYALKKKNSK